MQMNQLVTGSGPVNSPTFSKHTFLIGREIKAYKATLTISHSNQTIFLTSLKAYIAASALPPYPLTPGAAHEHMFLCWPVGTRAAQQSIGQILLLLKSLYLGALQMPRKVKSSRIYQIWESIKASLIQNSQNNQRSEAPKWIMRRTCHHVRPEIYCVVCVLYCIRSFWLLGSPSALPFAAWIPIPLPLHCSREAQVTSGLDREWLLTKLQLLR